MSTTENSFRQSLEHRARTSDGTDASSLVAALRHHPRAAFIALRHFLVFACVGFAVLLFADQTFAQGGGMRRAGGGNKQPKTTQPPKSGDKPPPQTPGMQTGVILKYSAAKEADTEKGILGYLSIRPFEKNAKLLKLAVFKPNEEGEAAVIVKVGDHSFEVEDVSEIFWKGLYCTAGWGYKDENAKVKVKELRTLTFDTIDVKGKVESVEDDIVTIRCTPRNGQDWPHLAAMSASSKPQTQGPNSKPPKIRSLKVKLKLVEEVSKVYDAENEETSLSSFERGQAIDANIVFSSKLGMLVKLTPPNSGNTPPPSGDDGGKKGGDRPPDGGRDRRGGGRRAAGG